MRIPVCVNGRPCEIEAPKGASLLSVLREELGLTAARFGCGHGVCGACFVLLDGQPIASCMLEASDASGCEIRTVEGLCEGERLHPVQQAFLDEDAMQCGYCLSGMLMSSVALLERNSRPSDDEIRDALEPHLCRCGIHARAVRAVRKAAGP